MQLTDIQQDINLYLECFLNRSLPDGQLKDACVYAVMIGGKRLRPALVYAAALMHDDFIRDRIQPVAAALELVHCYSLVHDDLPCMDDDALRRGNPTTHIRFGDATALLAGDALQGLAFKVLAEAGLAPDLLGFYLGWLSEAAVNMVHGQQLDLLAEHAPVSIEELENIHLNKTGALIRASLLMGAIRHPDDIHTAWFSHLEQLARQLGLAYQVQDDILDITETTETLGKPAASDLRLEKSTYPALLGLQGAQALLGRLQQNITDSLLALGQPEPLSSLTAYILRRNH